MIIAMIAIIADLLLCPCDRRARVEQVAQTRGDAEALGRRKDGQQLAKAVDDELAVRLHERQNTAGQSAAATRGITGVKSVD